MRILSILIIVLLASCNSNDKTIHLDGDTIAKGKMIKDSLLDGVVQLFDNSGMYIGYRTYKNGLPDGQSVTKRTNMTRDSVNYTNGFKNGYVYRLDKSNRIVYKSYYYFDKPVGNTYIYDSIGEIRRYCFYDFSGNIIFQRKYTDTGKYESGNLINMFSADRMVNDSLKTAIFIYTIYPPDEKIRYEIVVLDSANNITKSEPIAGEFYSERYVEPLLKPFRYAIVVRSYNPIKNKDDIIIQPIE